MASEEIVATVPEGATSGPVTVTLLNGVTSNGIHFEVLPFFEVLLTTDRGVFDAARAGEPGEVEAWRRDATLWSLA